ncbi:MAG: hypothetical protein F4010_06000 [Cenarchaeum sp. SB0669_bin_11]|nr:hypothetical protein [Cenarchaeum sp. SB0669_bin_11]
MNELIPRDIEIRIRDHLTSFLARKIQAVREISVADMEMNPFFIAAIRTQLAMKTQHDLAEWLVRQRVERSTVTGFGNTLQNIAKEFCHEKPLTNLTAKMIRDGKTYNLIIKSGPNHNTHVASGIQRSLLNSKKIEPDSVPVFGMCYGSRDSVGTIVKKYAGDIKQSVGKEFWEFVSRDADCYGQILKIADEVGKHYKDSMGNSLDQAMEQKIEYVAKELEKSYGRDLDVFWKNVVEDMY